jgi:hypothetical protein
LIESSVLPKDPANPEKAKSVAIKFNEPTNTEDEYEFEQRTKMIDKALRLAAELKHDNIIYVYNAGERDTKKRFVSVFEPPSKDNLVDKREIIVLSSSPQDR